MTDERTRGAVPGDARSEMNKTAETARQGAREVAETTKARARELAEEGKREGRRLAEKGQERARSVLDDQREAAAVHVRTLADALEGSAEELERSGQRRASTQISRAAGELGRLSESLRERDLDELLADAQDFARRSPALTFGLAASAGFLFTRFLKASGERRSEPRRPGEFSREGDVVTPASAQRVPSYRTPTTTTTSHE